MLDFEEVDVVVDERSVENIEADPRRFIELQKHSTSRNSMGHPRSTKTQRGFRRLQMPW